LIILGTDNYLISSENFEPKRLPGSELPLYAIISENGYGILSKTHVLYSFPTNGPPAVIPEVVSCAAANDRFIILKPDGRIFEMSPSGTRRQVHGVHGNPIKVFAGGAHFGCVTFEGEAWTWGCGARGQLGDGSYTISFTPRRVLMKDDLRVTDAAAGEEHTLLMAVKDHSFVPKMPEIMKENSYMKMVRMTTALQGAFVASEFDSKF
jgi:hypothetical protein